MPVSKPSKKQKLKSRLPLKNSLRRKKLVPSLLSKKQRLLASPRKPQKKLDYSKKRLKRKKMPASKLKRRPKKNALQKKPKLKES